MNYKLIGDVHAKIEDYLNIILRENPDKLSTIQIGDFGFQVEHDIFKTVVNTNKNKILFGNHDYYPYKHDIHSLGDWGIVDGTDSTFFIRGAYSLDHKYRTAGIDWFEDEQFTFNEYNLCLDDYIKNKPKIVISHDCPLDVILHIYGKDNYPNSTCNFLQALFEHHQPELWVFGHHHISLDTTINGTRFVCLAELEHKNFELI